MINRCILLDDLASWNPYTFTFGGPSHRPAYEHPEFYNLEVKCGNYKAFDLYPTLTFLSIFQWKFFFLICRAWYEDCSKLCEYSSLKSNDDWSFVNLSGLLNQVESRHKNPNLHLFSSFTTQGFGVLLFRNWNGFFDLSFSIFSFGVFADFSFCLDYLVLCLFRGCELFGFVIFYFHSLW